MDCLFFLRDGRVESYNCLTFLDLSFTRHDFGTFWPLSFLLPLPAKVLYLAQLEFVQPLKYNLILPEDLYLSLWVLCNSLRVGYDVTSTCIPTSAASTMDNRKKSRVRLIPVNEKPAPWDKGEVSVFAGQKEAPQKYLEKSS